MFDQPMINPYLNQNPVAPPININVVTGNDNKVGGEAVPAQKKSESVQGGSAFMNENIIKAAPTKVEPAPPAPAETKEKSFWGGILEGAGNIFVKKTG
jgi:hypothetical protein